MTTDPVTKTSTVVDSITKSEFKLLLDIALDLNGTFRSQDRYQRLVDAVRRILPADAVTLLHLEGDQLIPLASHGLLPEALGRSFPLAEHPRLDHVCRQENPTQFPVDSSLPDPFDGLVEQAPSLSGQVHACLGLPLRVEGRLVGVLALDSLTSNAFDQLSETYLTTLAALTGATLHTSQLIETLEKSAARQGQISRDLVKAALERRGGGLIGRSAEMLSLQDEIRLYARSDFPVLVTGETGTGKELAVRTLHAESQRSNMPLVYLNCAALPESVVESELFGHEVGAFTGAHKLRQGKFQVADRACLFLDEIGELPLSMQPKLLRVLQTGELQRVGSDKTISVDVRVFAATNRNLNEEVKAGRFRADLLHRLDVCRIQVPALRHHATDIPMLAGAFCDQRRRQLGFGPIRLHGNTHHALQDYPWPGNVRELENVISRAVLRASTRVSLGDTVWIEAADLGQDFHHEPTFDLAASGSPASTQASTESDSSSATNAVLLESGKPLRDYVDSFQISLIQTALEQNDGVWAGAAKTLGMHRSNLHHLAKRLEMI